MAKVRDILKHASIDTAGARRKCYRKPKEHSILKGELCLVLRDDDGRGKKNYCTSCAKEILLMASTKLRDLEEGLGAHTEVNL